MGCGTYTVEQYRRIWNFIHSSALRMNRKDFRVMMIGISKELKGSCGEGLRNYIKLKPITTRTEPFRYTWKLHNHVNKRLGKKEITYTKALRLYSR